MESKNKSHRLLREGDEKLEIKFYCPLLLILPSGGITLVVLLQNLLAKPGLPGKEERGFFLLSSRRKIR